MGDSSTAPRPLKLRSSCDACGAAKLKCDRGRPACGRCVSLDVQCVYGVSLKSSRRLWQTHRDANNDGNTNALSPLNANAVGMAQTQAQMTLSGVEHGFTLTSENFDMMNMDYLGWTSRDIDDTSNSPPVTATMQQSDKHSESDFVKIPCGTNFGCPREANTLLGHLSFIDQTIPARSGLGEIVNQVPLEHVIQSNREACERISHFFACDCARCPQLALQYASIFDKVMIRYQEAVGCFRINGRRYSSEFSADTTGSLSSASQSSVDTNPRHGSTYTSVGYGDLGHIDSGASGTVIPDTSISMLAQTVGASSTHVTMGFLSIDDQRVQAALKTQLVLSEVKRAGNVIDLFALQSFTCSTITDGAPSNGAATLYTFLSSWLRGEHTRTVDVVKAALNELNEIC